MRAKLRMLENISSYGLNPDYVKDREKIVNDMTIPRIKELTTKYVNPNKMIWLVVGDAETQLKRMKDLGFGEPIILNELQEKLKQ